MLLCVSTSSFAEVYIGGGVGSVDAGLDDISDFGSATGVELIVGSKINENLSIEASYLDFGEASDSFTPIWRVSADSLTFGALAIAPVNENVNLFIKLGLHLWDVSITDDEFGTFFTDDGTDIFFGAGVEFIVGEKVSLGVRYNSYDFDGNDVTMFSINAFIGF